MTPGPRRRVRFMSPPNFPGLRLPGRAVEAPFQLVCACGAAIRGQRQAAAQSVPCPACGRRRFVLPRSSLPFVTDSPVAMTPGRTTRASNWTRWLSGAMFVLIITLASALAAGIVHRLISVQQPLGEGALTAAFIPIFKEKEKLAGEKEMWRAANAVISGLLLATAIVAALGCLGISGALPLVQKLKPASAIVSTNAAPPDAGVASEPLHLDYDGRLKSSALSRRSGLACTKQPHRGGAAGGRPAQRGKADGGRDPGADTA